MKNYTPLLKERWDKGWPAFQKYFMGRETDKENEKGYKIYLKEEYDGSMEYSNFREYSNYKYTPVPEEVACMALKMLSEEREYSTMVGDYVILRNWQVDYETNINSIGIRIGNEYVIGIGWENGELVQIPYDEDEEGRYKTIDLIRGEHNIFDISGYYEARNFGFNWHKE